MKPGRIMSINLALLLYMVIVSVTNAQPEETLVTIDNNSVIMKKVAL